LSIDFDLGFSFHAQLGALYTQLNEHENLKTKENYLELRITSGSIPVWFWYMAGVLPQVIPNWYVLQYQ
jgi:hypothetical protein